MAIAFLESVGETEGDNGEAGVVVCAGLVVSVGRGGKFCSGVF